MWAASENHLSVCRRKPDMLESIWYAACPEEEKNATVANTKMRCFPPPPPPPLPTSVNAQHRQRVMCNSNRVDKDTRLFCISVYQMKSCKVTMSFPCGHKTGMMVAGSRTFFLDDCLRLF